MKEANTRSKSKKNMEDVKAPIAARVAQDQLLIKAIKDQLNNSETSMKSTLQYVLYIKTVLTMPDNSSP